MASSWERKEVLIVVKAYPNPSTKYGETVCTAGVLIDERRLVRLYPIPFRDLERRRQFRKYDIIRVRVRKATNDSRLESYNVDADSIEVLKRLPASRGWADRKKIVLGVEHLSMCSILRKAASDGASMGLVRPSPPVRFEWKRSSKKPRPGIEALYAQLSFLSSPKKMLDRIPYVFRYSYKCMGKSECPGHKQAIVDWEIGAAFRKWKDNYSDEKRVLEMMRSKWEGEIMGMDRDPYLFVGNQKRFQKQFMVLGVFWPPRETAGSGDQLELEYLE